MKLRNNRKKGSDFINTFIYFFLGFTYVCLLVWGLLLTKDNGLLNFTNPLLLVIVGLIYDNFIIALGRFIREGDLLESLSNIRFWSHALFTPTLILFAWSICFKFGLPWATKSYWKAIVILMTIGLILYELFTSIRGLELEPKWENDVLTYSSVQPGIPVMVILVTAVLAIIGFLLMEKLHFPWLLVGILTMIIGSTLANWIKNFPIMNMLELVLISTLLLTKQWQVRNFKNSHS